jgi:hypothetical protein
LKYVVKGTERAGAILLFLCMSQQDFIHMAPEKDAILPKKMILSTPFLSNALKLWMGCITISLLRF